MMLSRLLAVTGACIVMLISMTASAATLGNELPGDPNFVDPASWDVGSYGFCLPGLLGVAWKKVSG